MEAPFARGLSLTSNRRAGRAQRLGRMLARAQRATLAGCAFALPLAVLWNASDSYVLPKLLIVRTLALLLAALWLARGVLERQLLVRRTLLEIPLLAFVVSAGISTLFAVNHNLGLIGAYDRYEGLLTIVSYAAVFWLTVQTLRGPDSAQALLRVLLVSGYVAAVFAIGQALLASAHGVGAGESAFTFSGLARAQGTMGNPNLLATFLAMLAPLVLNEAIGSASFWMRFAWINVLAVMSLALLLSFVRAAWVGAAVALAIVGFARVRPWRKPRLLVGTVTAVALAGAVLTVPARGGLEVGHSILARVGSIADPTAGSNATRLHVWQDSVRLIASRPLLGYGPDSFGLVYPHFQTGNWTPGFRIDKAHADALQVASTQGLVGLAAYLGLLLASVLMFWRARKRAYTLALFAAWLAYQLPTQVNFSWLPAAAPFWLFLGAAAVLCIGPENRVQQLSIHRPWRAAAAIAAGGAALLLLVPAVVRPYQAESRFSAALQAELRGDLAAALPLLEDARQLAPDNPVYAVGAGNLMLRTGRIDQARMAFKSAIERGSEDAAAYRSLAIIDQLTGNRAEAIWAAEKGFQLDRFSRASQELLNQTTAQ